MKKSTFEYGTVVGFVPNNPNVVIITNGMFMIEALISGPRSRVRIGQKYAIYKQNSFYCLGARV